MDRFDDPAFSKHEIRIYQKNTVNALWHWFINDPEDVGRFSRKLGVLVQRDRTASKPRPRSRINPSDGVTDGALRSIISSIPGISDDIPPLLTTEDPEYGFQQLLELAIACWEYDCVLSEDFRRFAARVRQTWKYRCAGEFEERPSTSPRQRHIDWMFVALVFEWPDIFQAKSIGVVVKFEPRNGMDLERYRSLPEDFRDAVTESRRETTLETYNHIRELWMSLWEADNRNSSSMALIFSHFNQIPLGLDLRKPAPDNIHEQFDAHSLLRELETMIAENIDEPVGQVPDIQPLPSKRPASAAAGHETRKHARGGGGFGLAVRETFKTKLEASKTTWKSNAHSRKWGSTSSSDRSSEHTEWKETQTTFEAKLNNWRTRNLSGVSFVDSRFAELRSKHIQQPGVELETNGSRA